MAEQEARLSRFLTAEDLLSLRQEEDARREGDRDQQGRPAEDAEQPERRDDEPRLYITETIRALLDRLAAVSDADRKDRRALLATLAAENHEFETRVAAKLDEFRDQLEGDVAGRLAAVDEKVAALQASMSAGLDRLATEREQQRLQGDEVVARLNDRWAGDLEQLQTLLEKAQAQVLDAVAERSARDDELDRVLAEGGSRLDAVTERVATLSAGLDGLGAQVAAVLQGVDASQATVRDAVAKTTAEVADRLQASVSGVVDRIDGDQRADRVEAQERHEALAELVARLNDRWADDFEQLQARMEKSHAELLDAVAAGQAAQGDTRDAWRELAAALDALRDDVTSSVDEQAGRIQTGITDRVNGVVERWRADMDQLRSQWEGERVAGTEAITALLAARHDQLASALGARHDELAGALAGQRSRLDDVDARVGSVVGALRAEHGRLAQFVGQQVERLSAAIDEARPPADGVRAETFEARVDSLAAKVDDAVKELKGEQAALSATLAAKIDEATAALSEAESRLDNEAAEERTRWRSELTSLLDMFGQAFRLLSDEQERRLQEGVELIRSDVAFALQQAGKAATSEFFGPKESPARPKSTTAKTPRQRGSTGKR